MNNMELARQLMEAVRQTDEWERIWMEYPGLLEAKAQLDEAVRQVSAYAPEEVMTTLWETMAALNRANETACVLYGVRLACSVAGAMADPEGFSTH